MKASELRPGNAIEIDKQLFIAVKVDHVKPGKGPAYVQTKLKNLATGGHVEKRLRSAEDIDQVTLDRREMEYLYSDASGAVFMDNETYEQAVVPEDVLDDALLYVKPNTSVYGLIYEGKVMSVELPASVDLEVTDCPPEVKNATATGQVKEATLETGLKATVPAFINIGDTVRIQTETTKYLGRAND